MMMMMMMIAMVNGATITATIIPTGTGELVGIIVDDTDTIRIRSKHRVGI